MAVPAGGRIRQWREHQVGDHTMAVAAGGTTRPWREQLVLFSPAKTYLFSELMLVSGLVSRRLTARS